jgi:hypothetical protein
MPILQQLLAALKSLLTWWVMVAPWEQAVRVRGGKRLMLLNAGLHLRVPIWDRIYQQSTRRRFSVPPPQTLTTKDGKSLTVCVTVGYSIADLLLLYQSLHHPEEAVQAEVMGAVARVVTGLRSDECRPAQIGAAATGVVDLHRFGLTDFEITVVSYAIVRTYRFITGEGFTWRHGESLETTREAGVAA